VISQPQRNKNTNSTSKLFKYFAIEFFQCKILTFRYYLWRVFSWICLWKKVALHRSSQTRL